MIMVRNYIWSRKPVCETRILVLVFLPVRQIHQQRGNELLLTLGIKYLPSADSVACQDGDTAINNKAVPAPLDDGSEAPRLGSGLETGAALEGTVA